MKYTEKKPCSELGNVLLNYWVFQVPPEDVVKKKEIHHTAPADGCVSLFMLYNAKTNFRKAMLQGPTTSVLQTMVYPDTIYLGIRFYPGLSKSILGVSGKEVRNNVLDGKRLVEEIGAGDILEKLSLDFENFALIDKIFCELLQKKEIKPDWEVVNAASVILESGGKVPIKQIHEGAAVSVRQLQKRFLEEVGLTMKELAGLCKFRSTVINLLVRHKDYFDSLHEAGYYDQAHFIHHLDKLAKKSPAAFREYVEQIEHVGVAPYQELNKSKE